MDKSAKNEIKELNSQFENLWSDVSIQHSGKLGIKLVNRYLRQGGKVTDLSLHLSEKYPLDRSIFRSFVEMLGKRITTLSIDQIDLSKLIDLDIDSVRVLLSIADTLQLETESSEKIPDSFLQLPPISINNLFLETLTEVKDLSNLIKLFSNDNLTIKNLDVVYFDTDDQFKELMKVVLKKNSLTHLRVHGQDDSSWLFPLIPSNLTHLVVDWSFDANTETVNNVVELLKTNSTLQYLGLLSTDTTGEEPPIIEGDDFVKIIQALHENQGVRWIDFPLLQMADLKEGSTIAQQLSHLLMKNRTLESIELITYVTKKFWPVIPYNPEIENNFSITEIFGFKTNEIDHILTRNINNQRRKSMSLQEWCVSVINQYEIITVELPELITEQFDIFMSGRR